MIMLHYPVRHLLRCSFLVLLMTFSAGWVKADDKAAATAARLVPQQEKEGYEFRAEGWLNNLDPDMGRAVRIQMFKGNEYAFCIAVPPESGVHVTAAVLDFEGKPGGEILPVQAGWGVVLFYKPKKTGTYVVAIRQTDGGKKKKVSCAMFTGWK
ncbi:MAG: hypothetical protein HS117_01855 [Verrucomicrobiaceae bacterium]|nr:hypothetical protein [Verrucomicrobiaceae bacterium]